MNLNKVFIIGRLTADPQLRTTPSGQAVTSFGVATNRIWTDKSGAKQESTEFHNIVVWGRQAEIVTQFLTKGSTVLIEGRLQTRAWQGKDGQERRTTEIVADRVQFGPRPAGQGPASARATAGKQGSSESQEVKAEEIPTVDLEAGETKADDLPF